jgi:hypothetical protein
VPLALLGWLPDSVGLSSICMCKRKHCCMPAQWQLEDWALALVIALNQNRGKYRFGVAAL